ncbi:MAG: tRNA-dihydrouridine synthase family protein [Coriobacteriales bacterium]|jgi:nifR3 family TIM-barrel protein|nr:tRNA-dihydrouridine synthase family protein [Coriobacteriales bacterium]
MMAEPLAGELPVAEPLSSEPLAAGQRTLSMAKPFANGALVLAPMAGVNDPVFRIICSSLGADLTYTEMVSAKGLSYKNPKTASLLSPGVEGKPTAVQLFGSDPHIVADQAQQLEKDFAGAIALIDINMGCPARKIVSKGEGAALMKDPVRAKAILEAVVAATSLPVTVKFRKGYELADDNAVEFAKMAESSGVAAVAVHGRTARQFYHGSSDKELIARVKQALHIPVIASGDVFTRSDIRGYLEDYGADAVMVARGARGNPWIFTDCEPSLEERVRVAHWHTVGLMRVAPRRLHSMRRHISWYFTGTAHAARIRRSAHDCKELRDYEALFEQILAWR